MAQLPAMALAPGARIGPYEVQSAIGAGGMGQVYRARDIRLDRIVAIKVLPEHVASDPEARQRLEREARAISSLNHPHICTLFDVGQDNGTDYLVMEYLEGQTLPRGSRLDLVPLERVLSQPVARRRMGRFLQRGRQPQRRLYRFSKGPCPAFPDFERGWAPSALVP